MLCLASYAASGCGADRDEAGSTSDSTAPTEYAETADPSSRPPPTFKIDKPRYHARINATIAEVIEVDGTEPIPAEDQQSVEALRRWLKDDSHPARRAAALCLGKLDAGAAAAQDLLRATHEDPAGTVRVEAAVAYWRIAGEARPAVTALIDVLRRGGGALRIEAAWALADLGPRAQDAVEALAQVVKGQLKRPRKDTLDYGDGAIFSEPAYINQSPRSAAAEALARIAVKTHDVTTALAGLAREGRSFEQEAAARALHQLRAR